MSNEPTIIYTLTDEAPALATAAFLPVVRAFAKPAGVRVDLADISVAGRMVQQLVRRLRDAEDHIEIMMLRDTQSKIVSALLKLAQNAERVLTREELFLHVWGRAYRKSDRSVDVFVRKLRNKLERISPSWRCTRLAGAVAR